MEPVALHLREALQFVAKHHRHNWPTVGGKFAIGAALDGKFVGVAIAGRPVSHRPDDGKTLEVVRFCTDCTPNACSFLYARCAGIARLMGYEEVITYTLEEESVASLRAVGVQVVGQVQPKEWSVPSRPRKSQAVYGQPKVKWEL